jgi:Flp pilus assembly protein TadD
LRLRATEENIMQNEAAARLQSLVDDAAQAMAAGDLAAALVIAEQAARERLGHPSLLRIRAAALRHAGRNDDAGMLLNRALELAPGDPETIMDIGRLLVAEDRIDEAVAAFKAAIVLRPEKLDAWNALGAAHAGAGQFIPARAAFERASELAPEDPGPRADLAFMDARAGRHESARAHANEALRLQADHALATLALVRVDVDQQQFESARERLEPLLARGELNPTQRQIALGLLADTLDALGQTDDAFKVYSQVKAVFSMRHSARYGAGGTVESHLSFMQRLSTWFDRQDPAAWQQHATPSEAEGPVRRHVFLLGYLRSGVTLIESILASLPGVRVLEEGSTLVVGDRVFLRNEEALARLNPLDPDLARQARAAYWQRVREAIPEADGKIFVDMSPLYGIKLPMIARLFPTARVIVCRRDPRDVVVSCFRRSFAPNAMTYQLTSLDGIARHYDAAMRLTERHLAALPLPVHVVEYSQLVGNFDVTTRAIAEFVGAPWSENVRQFNRTAAGRRINTPSGPQVRRALFDGTGQWRRYRAQLAPVLPALQPWVTKYGYEP